MRHTTFVRVTLLCATLAAGAACGENSVPFNPDPVELGTGEWFLNTVDDSVLGSTIATRRVGVAEERTVVDSGWLSVDSYGEYEQRLWMRIYVNGVLDREETFIDIGSWTPVGDTNEFTSDVRARTFSVIARSSNRIESEERMLSWTDAPLTIGTYRRTRP